jgi:glucose/mannose transport system permease protein
LAMPAFGVSMIWQFTSIWNDYLIGLVILSNPDMRTVMVAVKNLTGSFFTNYGAQMAAALIAASPTIIIYLLLSRLFHRGLLAGSVKG